MINSTTLPLALLLLALGFALNSGVCAYLMPVERVDQTCYWWRLKP